MVLLVFIVAETPLAVITLTIPDILSKYCFHRLHELHSCFISQTTAEAVEAALEEMVLLEENAVSAISIY